MTPEEADSPTWTPDEDQYPGELTATYEILECVYALAETQTLRALNRKTQERVVVKCYRRGTAAFDQSEPPGTRELPAPLPRFVAEYRNVGMYCVIREYIPGYTLAEIARTHRYTKGDVLRIGILICEQLELLHEMHPPIIHCDIKPQNVVVRPDRTVVLIDFGVAQAFTGTAETAAAYGTIGFAPPEQYGFSAPDARSDIYSLGILMRWLLTGKVGPLTEPKTDLEGIIARCTALDPARRWQNAQELFRVLNTTLDNSIQK